MSDIPTPKEEAIQLWYHARREFWGENNTLPGRAEKAAKILEDYIESKIAPLERELAEARKANEWRPVKGYDGKYEVSNTGLIRKTNGGLIGNWSKDGYVMARLAGPRATVRMHRVVAEAFIPNPNSLPFVNHKDCCTCNNFMENLEWCTQAQNISHSEKLGRMQRNYWKGKRSPNAKLSQETVSQIRSEYESGTITQQKLGEKYEISKRTIGKIVNNLSYLPVEKH